MTAGDQVACCFFMQDHWIIMPTLATTSLIPMPTDPSWQTAMGILAAIGSMACWVFTSLSFTTAGKRFGSTFVNVTRSVLAALILQHSQGAAAH